MLAPASGQSGKRESVVATGEALSIAQRLLGVRSLQDVLPAEADEAPARPQGLGLGAKYLPHSKVCVSNGARLGGCHTAVSAARHSGRSSVASTDFILCTG